MKLMIDIPEELYEEAKFKISRSSTEGFNPLTIIVGNGIPLEKCEECVSLDAVIDVFDAWWAHNHESDNAIEILEDKLNALPPVTPTEKVGQWLNDGFYGNCRCSVCKHEFDCDIANMKGFGFALPKFCPNCGAKMEV